MLRQKQLQRPSGMAGSQQSGPARVITPTKADASLPNGSQQATGGAGEIRMGAGTEAPQLIGRVSAAAVFDGTRANPSVDSLSDGYL